MIRLRLLLVNLKLSRALSRLSRKLPHTQKALLRHLAIHKKQKGEYDETDRRIPVARQLMEQLKELAEKAYSLGFDRKPLVEAMLSKWNELEGLLSFGKKLTNLSVFLILCLQDLLLILQSIEGRRKTQASNFSARLVALNCHEVTDKLLELLGNHRLSNTGAEFLNPNTNREIKRAVFEVRQLRRQNFEQWDLVRNNCVAHRDDDAFAQLAIIEGLDALTLLSAGLKLIGILSRLVTSLTLESHNRANRCVEMLAEFQDLGPPYPTGENSFAKKRFGLIESLGIPEKPFFNPHGKTRRARARVIMASRGPLPPGWVASPGIRSGKVSADVSSVHITDYF